MPIQEMKCNENNCNHYLCKECPKKPIKLKPPTKKENEEFKKYLIKYFSFFYQKPLGIDYIINYLFDNRRDNFDNLHYPNALLNEMLDYVRQENF